MAANLARKLGNKEFCTDVNMLIRASAPRYDSQEAGRLAAGKLLMRTN